MTERTTAVTLFGHTVTMRYSDAWFGYAVVTIRITLGWLFFYSGMVKLLDPDWSAEGFLLATAEGPNPLAGLWHTLATEWLWIVDPLNEWGLTLIGLSILFGALVRVGSAFGILLMAIYYVANLPLEWGFIVDYHVIYGMLLFGLGAVGAGRLLGVDYYLENSLSDAPSWTRYVLG